FRYSLNEMVKKGKRVKKEAKTVAIDVGSDDDLYDEQDQFHNEDRKIAKGKIRQVHGKRVEEVLNVEGDDSEEEVDDGNSDFGSEAEEVDPDDESNLPSKEQWGRKRSDFYKAGYVDNDYGGVGSSDEEELAHLEELDAVSRQKQLDATTAAAAVEDDVWMEDETQKESKSKLKKTSKGELTVEKEWNVQLIREKNEDMLDWIEEYERTREVCESVVDELSEITSLLPKDSAVRKQLLLVSDTYAAYLLNLTLYLSLKSASFKQKKARDASVDDHPVVEKLHTLKKLVRSVDEFLGKNMEQVMELRERLKSGEKSEQVILDDIVTAKKSKSAVTMGIEEGMEGMEVDEGEEDVEGKRGVSYHITKNIQLNKKRKKGPSHSRAQKKVQYHKALIKRRSQVPDVRREDARYSGEARGIRVSTVKSTKLIA
ncbi:hypothetical protein PFISCL1PPCAC_5867, partial [Pristionchus fissidentatus]